MATTTPNYGWPVPTSTDYVKDGAAAIEALGDAIDATVFGLPTGALTLIKNQTIGTTVSSVTITGAFSATYDAYKVVISGGLASGSSNFNLVFGATTTGYVWGSIYNNYGASVVGGGSTTASNIDLIGNGTTAQLNFNVDVVNPFLAKPTQVNGFFIDPSNSGSTRGYLNNTTSYTDFKITPGSGTLTGGTVRVYGYANS